VGCRIRRIHQETDESYGAWRCWRQLRKEGVGVARCTVGRLMRGAGLVGVRGGLTCRATIPPRQPVAGTDLVARRFRASRPDELWVCDFTYIRTWQGWAYLAVVLDVYSRRIVGWQLAPHMRDRLVDDALAMAIASRKRPGEPLVAHIDNGSQYTSWEYTQRLRDAGIAPSRGRTGTALDSDGRTRDRHDHDRTHQATPWPTRLDLGLALLTWIGFYNERRIHRSLGGHTPTQITAHYHRNHPTVTEKAT
jgi:putative transposase